MGQFNVPIYMYLSNAFETRNHSILLVTSVSMELYEHENNLCDSYLSDSYQYVDYNNLKSKSKNVTKGMPHGSILRSLYYFSNLL